MTPVPPPLVKRSRIKAWFYKAFMNIGNGYSHGIEGQITLDATLKIVAIKARNRDGGPAHVANSYYRSSRTLNKTKFNQV